MLYTPIITTVRTQALAFSRQWGRVPVFLQVVAWGALYLGLLMSVHSAVDLRLPPAGIPADQSELLEFGWAGLFFVAVVLAPTIETFWTQWVPLEACRALNVNRYLSVILSAGVFSVGHHDQGMAKVIATFVCGLLLAELYLRHRGEYSRHAFTFVAGIHAVSNAIVIGLMYWNP